MLLIAAAGKQKRNTCKDYVVTIKGNRDESFFLDKSEIIRLLKVAAKGNIKGQSKESFNLQEMEDLLENNMWIKDAQLYFDNKDALHVVVAEREPVARIFTSSGKSFYIDADEKGIPLSENLSTRLPVFTNVPDKKDRTNKDSLLISDIRTTAQFISADPFWKSQVAQVDIVRSDADGSWQFEMVPLIGNHIVKLGDGGDIDKKFNRLFIFYKEILSRTGFDKYKTIDVRFAGQVIGGKSENPKVDSVQLRRNVEQLLEQIKKIEQENEAIEKSMTASAVQQPADNKTEVVVNAVSGQPVLHSAGTANSKSVEDKKTPKTVMKKVNSE